MKKKNKQKKRIIDIEMASLVEVGGGILNFELWRRVGWVGTLGRGVLFSIILMSKINTKRSSGSVIAIPRFDEQQCEKVWLSRIIVSFARQTRTKQEFKQITLYIRRCRE